MVVSHSLVVEIIDLVCGVCVKVNNFPLIIDLVHFSVCFTCGCLSLISNINGQDYGFPCDPLTDDCDHH